MKNGAEVLKELRSAENLEVLSVSKEEIKKVRNKEMLESLGLEVHGSVGEIARELEMF